MADLVIRGMEMPSCCLICPMYTISGCRVSKRIFPDWMNVAAIPKDCPLVPLPEGHGRLIDADAVVKTICNSCDGACDVVQCDCLNCKADCRCDIVKEISDAPTIVPAEGGTK